MFWFILYSTAANLTITLPLVALGLFVEAAYDRRVPASMGLNLWLSVGFYLTDAIVAATLGSMALSAIGRVPGYAAVPLPTLTHVLAGQIAILLVTSDFCYYWMHRMQHAVPWLWAFHAIHHSDEHMHVTTARRSHGLELPLLTLCVTLPVSYLFGPSARLGLAFVVFSHAFAYFTHLNVPWSLRRWNWLITTPRSHRLHHSRDRAHFDKNFAMFTPVWDRLFGTYLQPPEGPIETGVPGVVHATWQDAYTAPLRRR